MFVFLNLVDRSPNHKRVIPQFIAVCVFKIDFSLR